MSVGRIPGRKRFTGLSVSYVNRSWFKRSFSLGSEQRERLGKSERQLEVTQSNSRFDRSHPGSEQRERLGKSERQLEVTQSNSRFDRSHPGSEQRERLGSSERQFEVKNYLETMTLLGRTIRSCSM